MQINRAKRIDLHQWVLFWCVVVLEDRSTCFIRIVILTGEDRPPQHTTDQYDEHQR